MVFLDTFLQTTRDLNRLPTSERTSAPELMAFINISSQGDLSTTSDHLSIEIAVYFGSPDQRCMGHHVEDHSTNHRGWAHGYRLRRNLIWWIKLIVRIQHLRPFRAATTGTFETWVTCLIYMNKRTGRKSNRHNILQYQVTVAQSSPTETPDMNEHQRACDQVTDETGHGRMSTGWSKDYHLSLSI